jgi:hypothetical protein
VADLAPLKTVSNAARIPSVYVTTGTLTAAAYPNAKYLRIEGVNGGGGSGGCQTTIAANSAHSGPGAGGAYAVRTVPVSSLTFPLTVTVGAGGAAGAAGNNAGGVGGQSSVTNGASTYWTPGVQSTNQKGLGGATGAVVGDASTPGFDGSTTGGVGDVIIPGQGANVPTRVSAAAIARAYGGNSQMGGGGLPGNGAAGTAGSGFGSGGGGSYIGASATQVTGATGAGGIVIITPVY